jgi:hypothetical protein
MESETYTPKCQRWITKFDKNGNFIEDEISVDSIEIETLKNIFIQYEDDPYFVMLYHIYENEALELKKYIDFNYDFTKFQYELSTYNKD